MLVAQYQHYGTHFFSRSAMGTCNKKLPKALTLSKKKIHFSFIFVFPSVFLFFPSTFPSPYVNCRFELVTFFYFAFCEKDNSKKPLGGNLVHGCCQIWPDLQIWAAQIWPDLGKFFFFLKKNFFPDVPDLARSGQIWPHLGDLGRLGKFFFPGTPNDITKYRLKYRSIYVARVCKLRGHTRYIKR